MSFVKNITKKVLEKETSRFIVVGSFNTLFCYIIFTISLFVGLEKTLAMTIATLTTIGLSFSLMGRYVFVSVLTLKRSLVFLAMQIVGYVININILRLVSWVGASDYLGGIISLLITAVFTYLVTKHIVFL